MSKNIEKTENNADIKTIVKDAEIKVKGLKVEVLKHFLKTFILSNKNEIDFKQMENNHNVKKMKEMTVLFKKLLEIEKNFTDVKLERKAVGDIKRNRSLKGKGSNASNPKQKIKKKFKAQNKMLEKELNNIGKKSKKF
ncbi:hypothetical protein EHP00_37 [Ecytonucleospora hepatopenaei]|uniref:Uncharacterized protein n=1 Tax=Ecytonucleospora hepatopenaei TaxID=646526 RepID=A0A1W0E5L0_9MICR|nr:hypothetical protein EHP00_37 [Ecytonucleospora hepatopenaei]